MSPAMTKAQGLAALPLEFPLDLKWRHWSFLLIQECDVTWLKSLCHLIKDQRVWSHWCFHWIQQRRHWNCIWFQKVMLLEFPLDSKEWCQCCSVEVSDVVGVFLTPVMPLEPSLIQLSHNNGVSFDLRHWCHYGTLPLKWVTSLKHSLTQDSDVNGVVSDSRQWCHWSGLWPKTVMSMEWSLTQDSDVNGVVSDSREWCLWSGLTEDSDVTGVVWLKTMMSLEWSDWR